MNINCRLFITARIVILILLIPCMSLAQDATQGGQALDQAANDPTASLMAVQVQNLYSGDDH